MMEKRPFGMVVILFVVVIAVFGIVHYVITNEKPVIPTTEKELNYFNSLDDMKDYVLANSQNENYLGRDSFRETMSDGVAEAAPMAVTDKQTGAGSGSASDYSHTNIQVEGVDEPDIVKNDGKYIYSAKGSSVYIVEAYPAENMRIVNSLNMDSYVSNIFVGSDRLVVFTPSYESVEIGGACPVYREDVIGGDLKIASSMPPVGCGWYGKATTNVYVYDISDKNDLKMVYNISIDGNYVDSRMIGDYVYTITNKYISLGYGGLETPSYVMNDNVISTPVGEIGYFRDYDSSYTFTSVASVNIKNGKFSNAVYMTGSNDQVYVSKGNIYLTHSMYISVEDSFSKFVEEVALPLMPVGEDLKIKTIAGSELKQEWQKQEEVRKIIDDYSLSLKGQEKQDFDSNYAELLQNYSVALARERQKTMIHKILINDGQISYESSGVVPGSVLNQFSMDEYKGKLRIATTTGEVWNGNSLNHLYILDSDMNIIGKVEDLAHGERIYSARFMGDRVYLVTFKNIDPLFVIDASNSRNPKVLGYLKVSGYSDYLHPYDETHVIGIGKEVNESIDADKVHSSNAVYYTAVGGVKISLFDVSDVENPIETAKIEIGERGTESAALNNHKAFLFDKEKNLLVIPINLYEIDENDVYGDEVWQGAYVFNITESDISIKGRITHRDNESLKSCSNYTDWQTGKLQVSCYWPYDLNVQRSLYMDDTLYTLSEGMIKANNLKDLKENGKVDFPVETYYGRDYYAGSMAI